MLNPRLQLFEPVEDNANLEAPFAGDPSGSDASIRPTNLPSGRTSYALACVFKRFAVILNGDVTGAPKVSPS